MTDKSQNSKPGTEELKKESHAKVHEQGDQKLAFADPAVGARQNLSLDALTPGAHAGQKQELAARAEQKTTTADYRSLNCETLQKLQILHDALHNQNNRSFDSIATIFDTTSERERQLLESQYERVFSEKLRDTITTTYSERPGDRSRLLGLLTSPDDHTNTLGGVERAHKSLLTAISQEYQHSLLTGADQKAYLDYEKNLINVLLLSSKNLTKDDAAILNQKGEEIAHYHFISDATREAAKIIINAGGIDNMKAKDFRELANIGLKYNRLDIFKDAFKFQNEELLANTAAAKNSIFNNDANKRIASESKKARDEFVHDAKAMQAVADKFKNTDFNVKDMDYRTAIDTLEHGDDSWQTKLAASANLCRNNKDVITQIVSQTPDEDRQKYFRGKALAPSSQTLDLPSQAPITGKDKDDLDFYNDVHSKLRYAASPGLGLIADEQQVALWEAKLNKAPKLVEQIIQTQHTNIVGGISGWGSGHKTDDILQSIEKLSQEDCQVFAKPEAMTQLKQALKEIHASQEETNRILQMLDARIKGKSAEAAGRTLEEKLADNRDDSAKQIDTIVHMSAQDQAQYKDNRQFRDHTDQLLNLHTASEQELAKRLLAKVKDGHPPVPDAYETILLDTVTKADPFKTINDIERAINPDPENPKAARQNPLYKKFDDPNSPEHRLISQAILNAAGRAQAMNERTGAHTPESLRAQVEDAIYKGHIPLYTRLLFNNCTAPDLSELGTLSSADRKELKERMNSTMLTVYLPGSDTQEMKKVYGNVLDNNGKATDSDTIRHLVLGGSNDPHAIVDFLKSKSKDQLAALAKDYTLEYKGDLVVDAANAAADDRQTIRDLFTKAHKTARETAIETSEEHTRHTSPIDNTLDQLTGDKRQAESKLDDVIRQAAKFTDTAAFQKELNKLPAEQQAQAKQKFSQALNEYYKAESEYVHGKQDATEAVVNATITAGTIAASCFPPVAAARLLLAAGAAGAAFRVAAEQKIMGTDFDPSLENVLKESAKGASATVVGMFTLDHIGLAVGDQLAENAAMATAKDLSKQFGKQLGEGKAQAIAKELSHIKPRDALLSSVSARNAYKEIAERHGIAESQIKAIASVHQAQMLKQTLALEGLRYVHNVVSSVTGNVGAEYFATATGLEDPNTLYERIAKSAEAGLVGASLFHVGARALAGAAHGIQVTIGRDEHNQVYLCEGTRVHPPHGDDFVVGDELYYPKTTDQVVVPKTEAKASPNQVHEKPSSVPVADPPQPEARTKSNKIPTKGDSTDHSTGDVTKDGKDKHVQRDKPSEPVRVETAELTAAKTNLQEVIKTHFSTEVEQTRIKDLMVRFEKRADLSAHEIQETYKHISDMLVAKSAERPLSLEDRKTLAGQILRNAADAYHVSQGNNPTCNVSTVSIQMFDRCPSEAARNISELARNGYVTVKDGSKIELSSKDLSPDLEAKKDIEQHSTDPCKRTYADQILQTLAVNTKWQRESTGPNGRSYTKKDIRYERCVPEQTGGSEYAVTVPKDKQAGKDSPRAKDGRQTEERQAIKASPGINLQEFENIYEQLTKRKADFVIYPAAEWGVPSGGGTSFSGETGLGQLLEKRKPSEHNSLVIAMHTGAEPFVQNHFNQISGADGGPHVITIVGYHAEGNPPYVIVHNTNHPNSKGGEIGFQKVTLHDLYLASQHNVAKTYEAEMVGMINQTRDPKDLLQLLRSKFSTEQSALKRELQYAENKLQLYSENKSLLNRETLALVEKERERQSSALKYIYTLVYLNKHADEIYPSPRMSDDERRYIKNVAKATAKKLLTEEIEHQSHNLGKVYTNLTEAQRATIIPGAIEYTDKMKTLEEQLSIKPGAKSSRKK